MKYNIENVIEELIKVSKNNRFMVDLPNDKTLENYQKEIGISFSQDYTYYLKKANNIFYNLDEIVLVTNRNENESSELKKIIKEARKLGLDEKWIPLCEDNGNYYCLTPKGNVKYYDLNGKSNEEWDSLAFWIKDVWIDEN